MREGPIDVPRRQARELASMLPDYKSYSEDPKACLPVYGVRVKFVAESKTIDVLFCFGCDILTVYLDDKYVGGGHFDKSHHPFLNIIQPLFPDDKQIQSL